jgi:hypothetical protein
MKTISYLGLVVFLLVSQSLIAQDSKEELSQQAANPLAGLMSFPFQNNLNYGPKSKVTWGIGPVIEIPSGGEKRGTQKWSAEPSFVIPVQPGEWTFGALLNNTRLFAEKYSFKKENLKEFIRIFIHLKAQ